MTVVYPSSLILYAYISSAWLDISDYQIGSYTGHWGISRNGPIDFLADTGELKFTLINTDARFTPGGVALFSSDWKKGCKIKLEVSYDGRTRSWYGAISDFDFDPNNLQNGDNITVTVVDWMDKAAKYPLNYPDILLEQTSDEAVQAILDAMPIQPLEQEFAVGTQSFPVVFDTVGDFTKARAEFQKILLSELCYMYLRHGGSLGEKLILENADTRSSAVAKTIPVASDDSGFLLMETGDFLLLETGDKIILDEAQDFESNDDAIYDVGYGDNVINSIQFRFTPRIYSAYSSALNVCWSTRVIPEPNAPPDPLNFVSETSLGASETVKIISTYKWDVFVQLPPQSYFAQAKEGLRKCLIAPPFPTSFGDNAATILGNVRSWNSALLFGGGTRIADIEVSDFRAYADRFEATYTNPNAEQAWMLHYLNIEVGSARIIVDPDVLIAPIQDTSSINDNDYQPLQWDMPYQIDSTAGTVFADKVLWAEAQPRTVLNRIHYNANRSAYNMNAFMNLDVGDLFPAVNVNKGIDSTYFVQDMKFEIAPGGVIDFSLGVKENNMNNPVEFVSVSTQTGANVASINWSHTVAAGNGRLLVVAIATRGSDTVSAVTFGSQSLTLFQAYEQGNTNSDSRVEVWYLIAPDVGTQTVTVTTSAGSYLEAASMDYVWVNQASPFGTAATASGTSTAATVTVVGEAGDIIFDILSTWTTVTVGADQTQRMNATSDNSWRGAVSTEPGAVSAVMSWTLGSSQKWATMGVAIKRA